MKQVRSSFPGQTATEYCLTISLLISLGLALLLIVGSRGLEPLLLSLNMALDAMRAMVTGSAG